jgi:protein-disulfide isomerase
MAAGHLLGFAMNKSVLQKIVIAVIALAAVGCILAFLPKHSGKKEQIFQIDTSNQPTKGNPNAKVQVVIFEDLKCIACRNFNNSVLPKMKAQYIEPGIAKYTVINVAFIPGSMPAANAARCLYAQNPDWFFQFVDNVYQHQPPENEDWATIPQLMQFAGVIQGVDQDKLSRCIYESPYTDFIQNNFKLASKIQGNSVATPAVYVNGRFVDPPSFKNIQKAIDAAK